MKIISDGITTVTEIQAAIQKLADEWYHRPVEELGIEAVMIDDRRLQMFIWMARESPKGMANGLEEFLHLPVDIRLMSMLDRTYRFYLTSNHWNRTRARIKERDGQCVACGWDHELQVHHKTYERIGHEDDADLITLCRDCHQKEHYPQLFA